MKKTGALLIAALIWLLAGVALAEPSIVARNGSLSAYLDGEGRLYLPGNEQPINRAAADALVSIDPYRLLFMSTQADGTRDLYMINLSSFMESLVAKNVCDACMADEDALYYVPGSDRKQLMRMDMKTLVSKPACTAAEPIDRMYNSAEGLVFEQVDGTGTMIYNRLTGKFDSYLGALPQSGMRTDSFELTLDDGSLYIRNLASLASEHIDAGVRDYAVMNGNVYYLCNSGSAARLKCYDPTAMTWQVVLTLDSTMERQLTASAKKLFLLDGQGQIYTVDLIKNALQSFTRVPDTASYNLPKGYAVSGLKLEAMDGQLNVYAELEDAASQPSFSFIEFTPTSDSSLPVVRLLKRYAIEGEETVWTRLKPAKQYSPLSRGSRGAAVRAIQRPLYALGYYDYYIDGIFGPRTQYAVCLLQSDLNLPVTGVADSELQRLILDGKAPRYDAYMALTRGNRGLRVQIMQEKLRDLGYQADAADGIFGANTQRAVQLFQSENGLGISDGATRETLKRLYSGYAARCTSFIDLYPGYTGCRVRELNNRLQALYYLEYNPGGSYTFETAEAVRAFQRCAGLPVNGNATVNVLRKLFSRYAPESPGYITLRLGDENDRVEALQLRLKKLNYYSGAIDGYFGRTTQKAVKLFQKKVGLNVTGVATVRTQQLLFSKDAPVYVKPTVIGKPVITVERFDVRENDVYYITDESAGGAFATFSWYAEGEVKEFGVKVEDADHRVLLDQKTLLTRTGVSLATLELDKVYTLTITAYPEDGRKKHITSDSIRFVHSRKRENPVGEVTDPVIFINTVLRTQGGVQYLQPGEAAFHWHADGQVDRYLVEIFNSSGDALFTSETREEQTAMPTSRMNPGQICTIFVYAIPTNGTLENATTAVSQFALEDVSVPTPTPEPEEPDVTPEPLVTLEPTQTPEAPPPNSEAQPVEEEETPGVTFPPEAEESPVPETPAEEVPAEEAPAEEAPAEEAPAEEAPAEEAPAEEAPAEEAPAEEAPAEEAPAEEAPAEETPVVEVPEVESEPIAPPELFFETTIEQRDDICYVADDVLVMYWTAVEGVGAYHVEVVDGAGRLLAATDTGETHISVKQGSMIDGEIYTLIVTTMPADGSDGVTASARFALYREDVPEGEPAAEAPVVEEPAADAPVVEQPYVEEEPVVELPYIEEEPVVEQPYIEEEPVVEQPYIEEEPVVEQPHIEEEPVVEQPHIEEEPVVEQPYIEEEPVVEQPYIEEEPVVEQPYIEEEPVIQEPYIEEPVEAEAPEDKTAIEMDPETTAQVQNVLVSWGWLAADSFEPGAADAATLSAINAFEAYFNENYEGALTSSNGMIDVRTLALLLNQEGVTYPRPE